MEPLQPRRQARSLLVLVLLLLLAQAPQSQAYKWMSPSAMCDGSGAPVWTGPAPPLPTLPQQYSLKVEANLLQRNRSVEVEEHYDSINQRASVAITRNGTTVVSIFNFQTNQRYNINPDGTCKTMSSFTDFIGFVSSNKLHKPVMAPVNDVFHFGTKYNMTYIGKEIVRGIRVNHWMSCQEWAQFGAKFQLDYYFSEPNYTTAMGAAEIPVRAVLNGSAPMPMKTDQKYIFQHTYDFLSFRAGPILNEEVFQIPPGVVCSGRTDNKPLPAIPDQLELSMEVIRPDHPYPWEEYLHYDYSHKLVETISSIVVPESMGFRQPDSSDTAADNDNLIAITASIVKDYNNGLVYVTEMVNMSCSIKLLPDNLTALTMAHGQNLFAVSKGSNQFMYQGQTTLRGILVDMWAMEEKGVSVHIYFQPNAGMHNFQPMVGMLMKNRSATDEVNIPKLFQQVFESDDMQLLETGNSEDSSSRKPPTKRGPDMSQMLNVTGDQLAWGVAMERLVDRYISTKTVNIFHYSPLHLDTDNFQVSHCYRPDQKSQVMLMVMAHYYKDVLLNYPGFINSLRSSLAQKVGVSLLHISNLVPTPYVLGTTDTNAIKVTFTLLGSIPTENKPAKKGIKQAKMDLIRAISKGISFHVQYITYSKDFMVHSTIYVLDYDKQETDVKNDLVLRQDSIPKSPSSESGYLPGAVAGISIATLAVGAAITGGVIYLLHRWKKPGQALFKYQHSTC